MHVTQISERGIIPRRTHTIGAGFILFAPEAYTIPGKRSVLVKTDIALEFTSGTTGHIMDRPSSQDDQHPITVRGGGIHPEYRGNIGVILINHSDIAYGVEKGEAIAKVIIQTLDHTDIGVMAYLTQPRETTKTTTNIRVKS